MKTVFNHTFDKDFNLKKIEGYREALTEVYQYLCDVTQWKPENRFIDAVPLLERIQNTADDLTKVMQKEGLKLQTLSDVEKDLLMQESNS